MKQLKTERHSPSCPSIYTSNQKRCCVHVRPLAAGITSRYNRSGQDQAEKLRKRPSTGVQWSAALFWKLLSNCKQKRRIGCENRAARVQELERQPADPPRSEEPMVNKLLFYAVYKHY